MVPHGSGLRRMNVIWGALLLGMALSFFVRAYQGPAAAQAPFVLKDPDSLYHFRLAGLIARDFPRIPAHDPYLGFPREHLVPWGFLQDLAAAAVYRLSPGKGEEVLRAVCFHLPALLGALSLFFVFLLARQLGLAPWPSVGAGVVASLVPAQMSYTLGGRFDHHAGDLFTALIFFCLVVSAWRRRGEDGSAPGVLMVQGGMALATAAMFLNWLGAFLHVGILLLAAAGSVLISQEDDPRLPVFLERAGWSLAGGAGIFTLAVLSAFGSSRLAMLETESASGLQPLLLAGTAAVIGLLGRFSASGPRRALRHPVTLGLMLVVVTAGALTAGTVRDAVSLYLGPGDRIMASIQEVRSSFVDQGSDPLNPRFSLAGGLGLLGGGVLLFPFFLAAAARNGLGPAKVRGFPLVLFLCLAGVFLVLALLHYRFANVFSIPCGIGAGILLSRPDEGEKGPRWRYWRRGGAVWIPAILLSCLPGLSFAADNLRDPLAEAAGYGSRSAMEWIAARTPVPSDPFDLKTTPAYGVLAPMDLGNAVIVLARRPSIATGFVHGTLGRELVRVAEAFTETDPARLRAFMDENRLRYLLLPAVSTFLDQDYFVLRRDALAGLLRRGGSPALYAAGAAPVSLRLWETLGSATDQGGRPLPSCGHFRLVFEGASRVGSGSGIERYMLFEVLPGASLQGRAAPGSWVVASLELDTPFRKGVWWEDLARAGPDGRFSMTVPYPTGSLSGETRPHGPYEVREGKAGPVRRVEVSEEAVIRGLIVPVPRAAGG